MQNQEQFYRLFYSSDTGSSESSDYCQITEYIPPESQNEQECIKKNIKQEVEYVNWEDKFLLSKVLGDGHCIARCFAEYFDSSIECPSKNKRRIQRESLAILGVFLARSS